MQLNCIFCITLIVMFRRIVLALVLDTRYFQGYALHFTDLDYQFFHHDFQPLIYVMGQRSGWHIKQQIDSVLNYSLGNFFKTRRFNLEQKIKKNLQVNILILNMSYHLPQNSKKVWSTTKGLKLPANLQFILKNLKMTSNQ